MAISFVGAALTNPAGANTTVTANLPAGILTGDLMILSVTENKAPIVITDPTGWTAVDGPTAETAATQKIYYRVATVDGGTAPTISSDTTGQWRADVAVYRGVDQTAPFLAHGARIEPGSGTTVVHTAPTLTNTDPGAWGVFAAAFRQVSTPASWTPGAGLTERIDADTGNSTSANLTQCFDDTAGPIAAGDWTFSASSSSGSAQAIMWAGLLNPASTGPAPSQGSGTASWSVTASGSGITSRSGGGTASWSVTASGAGSQSALLVPRHTFIAAKVAPAWLDAEVIPSQTGGPVYGLGTQALGSSPLGGAVPLTVRTVIDVELASDGTSEASLVAVAPLLVTLHTND